MVYKRLKEFFGPIAKSLSLMSHSDRRTYFILLVARVVTNSLDLVGLAIVALFGSMVAARIAGNAKILDFGFLVIDLESGRTFVIVLGLLVSVFVLKSIFATALLRLNGKFLARVEAEAAAVIVSYAFGSNLTRIQKISYGRLNFAMSTSASIAFSALLTHFNVIVTETALFILVFLSFLYVDPIAAVVVTIYFGTLLTIFQLVVSKRLVKAGEVLAETAQLATNYLLDLVKAYKELYVIDKTRHFLDGFRTNRLSQADAYARMRFYEGSPRFFIEAALMAGIALLVAWYFVSGSLANGLTTTVVFLTGGFRMMGALLPLQNAIAWVKGQSPQALVAQELLQEARANHSHNEQVLDQLRIVPPLESMGELHQDVPIGVHISHADFAYPDALRPAVKDLSMLVEPGDFVALVGPSGAGKTTIVDLLLGILEADAGKITIEGLAPKEFIRRFPGSIAYVPQRPGVVSGTFASNVALGWSMAEIDGERVSELIDLVGLKSVVEERGGIFAPIGGQVEALSGGQIQRLGLARALYSSPGLLILDEATSALDAQSEADVVQLLEKPGMSMTRVVIAHRLSTVKRASVLHVIEEGEITDSGTFRDLRKKNRLIRNYAALLDLSESDNG